VRRSRDVWIGAALLAIAAAGIGLLVQSPNTAGPPYRLAGRGPLGLSGLGAGLRDAGFGVDERVSPTIPDHGLVVSVEPRAFSHDEAAAWVRSIRAGAVLLLASDHRNPLTEALGLRFGGPADTRPTAAGMHAFPGVSAGGRVAATTFSRLPRGAVALVGGRAAAAVALVPLGRGSVFSFGVRFKIPPPRAEADTGGEPAGQALADLRALVADDNEVNALVLGAYLEVWGVRFDVVTDGRQAIEKAGSHDYDVVLMDLHMPGLDGYAATRAIRSLPGEKIARLPIIAVSASMRVGHRDEIEAAGFSAFVGKPIDPDTLFATIARLTARGPAAGSEVP